MGNCESSLDRDSISACGTSDRMKPGLPIIATACLTLSLSAALFGAASVSSSFGVSATVAGGCLAVATPVSFAATDGTRPGATPAVSVNCTNPTAYSVGFSSAVANGGPAPVRRVTGAGAALLGYGVAAGPMWKVDKGETVSVETAGGVWSLDPHALAREMQEASTRRGSTDAGRAYPDSILVTITY